MATKHFPDFRRATPATWEYFPKNKRFSLRVQWVKGRSGHGETSACFGGVNLTLPRASPGPPIFRCLNFFTASGGRRGISGIAWLQKSSLWPGRLLSYVAIFPFLFFSLKAIRVYPRPIKGLIFSSGFHPPAARSLR
jgi:hypothetical protein